LVVQQLGVWLRIRSWQNYAFFEAAWQYGFKASASVSGSDRRWRARRELIPNGPMITPPIRVALTGPRLTRSPARTAPAIPSSPQPYQP
jgi:hypothetical protein